MSDVGERANLRSIVVYCNCTWPHRLPLIPQGLGLSKGIHRTTKQHPDGISWTNLLPVMRAEIACSRQADIKAFGASHIHRILKTKISTIYLQLLFLGRRRILAIENMPLKIGLATLRATTTHIWYPFDACSQGNFIRRYPEQNGAWHHIRML